MRTSPTTSVEIIGVEGGVSGTEVGAINFSASAANRPVNMIISGWGVSSPSGWVAPALLYSDTRV